MMFFRLINKAYLGFVVILLCLCFLLFCNFDISTSRVVDEIFEYGHLPLFGVVSLGFVIIFKRNPAQAKLRPYLSAWIITVILGISTELIQIIIPERFFEIRDIFFDAIGAGCFLTLAYPFPDIRRRVKRIFQAAAVLIMITATIPIFLAAGDDISMKNSFPLMSSFETHLEMGRWVAKKSEITRSRLHSTNGEYSLEIHLLPDEYPGIFLKYLKNDWQGYKCLVFDVFLAGETPLNITVRIHDMDHNQEYEDRFKKSFLIAPGDNSIFIDLKEVTDAPKGRKMDMGNIKYIYISSDNLDEQRILYLDNVRLEPNFCF